MRSRRRGCGGGGGGGGGIVCVRVCLVDSTLSTTACSAYMRAAAELRTRSLARLRCPRIELPDCRARSELARSTVRTYTGREREREREREGEGGREEAGQGLAARRREDA